ncbi:hypothetical protein B5M09_002939 [Aphanomyces astaci]|uniref:Uncharacterized protein n=1 Tax=Aphanomyces astaci TaxID=112090 RepID=A0A3R7X3P5_APHAT|nr:hypothetical protein B5M09_002939 [Aphanomyces astaci]
MPTLSWVLGHGTRAFHILGFFAGTVSYIISTHVVFERPYPSWDGGGAKATLPWATFLSFWHGVCSLLVVLSWGLAQEAMDVMCVADNLTKKRPCISATFTYYEAKHTGALMDGFLLAAKTDDIDEILGQVAAKADINALGSDGRNALHWACALNRSTVVHILVKKGANISQKDHGADVNAKDTWGTTPLMLTVLGKSKTGAQCLLELGANINARNVFGQTAIMLCVAEDAEMHAFVVMLINADASLKTRDYGDTPLAEARLRGRANTVALLEHAIDPALPPPEYAASEGDEDPRPRHSTTLSTEADDSNDDET